MRPIEEYRNKALHFNDKQSAGDQWAELSDWFAGKGRQLFVDAFSQETGLTIRSGLHGDTLVAAAVPKSINDLDRKAQGDAFYRAQAAWFLQEMDVLVLRAPHSQGPAHEIQYGNLMGFVRNVLFDSYLLFEHWAQKAGVPGVFGARKNHVEHVMHFAQGVRQVIYGHGTFGLSFADSHSDLATATIRQMLEIRLRRGFGIVGKKSKTDGSFHPVGLSVLLDAIGQHRLGVHLPVRFENISRINSWANLYLHAGLKIYAWMPPRVVSYLWHFVVGTVHGGSKAGITLGQATFDAIRHEVRRQTDNASYEAILDDQQDCDAIIT